MSHAAYMRQWRKDNPDLIRAIERRRYVKDFAKVQARNLLNSAVRYGKVKRQKCEVCGGSAEAHHTDYSKPLDVRWLCKDHHEAEHHE